MANYVSISQDFDARRGDASGQRVTELQQKVAQTSIQHAGLSREFVLNSTGESYEGSTELQSKKSIFRNGRRLFGIVRRSSIPFVASGALLAHETLLNFVFR